MFKVRTEFGIMNFKKNCKDKLLEELTLKMSYLKKEHVFALIFDSNDNVLDFFLLGIGDEKSVKMDYEILKCRAEMLNSSESVIVIHNHPCTSYNARNDIEYTYNNLRPSFNDIVVYRPFITLNSGKKIKIRCMIVCRKRLIDFTDYSDFLHKITYSKKQMIKEFTIQCIYILSMISIMNIATQAYNSKRFFLTILFVVITWIIFIFFLDSYDNIIRSIFKINKKHLETGNYTRRYIKRLCMKYQSYNFDFFKYTLINSNDIELPTTEVVGFEGCIATSLKIYSNF